MMRWLLPLASSFLADDVGAALRRARRRAAIWGLVAVLAATTYIFLLIAAYQRLSFARPADEAALIVAAAALAIAAAIVGVAAAFAAADRRRTARRRAEARGELAVALSTLPLVLRSRPLLIAAAIGTLAFLGTQPGRARKE